MDLFAHALWTAAAATGAKRKIRLPKSTGWTVWWGVFPDLFTFTLPVTLGLWYRVTAADAAPSGLVPRMPVTWQLYQTSHSLVVFLAVFALVRLIARRPIWSMLGWSLHILIDIPSHTARYATPFLWPVSSWRFTGGVSWRSEWFMIVNYTALAVVWFAIWYTRQRAMKPEVTHAGT